MKTIRLLVAFTFLTALWGGCAADAEVPEAPSVKSASTLAPTAEPAVVEVVYKNGLGKGWQDYGWAPREIEKGPARIDMSNYGGWIIAHPGLKGQFGSLVIRMRAPAAFGDFFEVRLASDRQDTFPQILVQKAERAPQADGTIRILLPISRLNPDRLSFDRIMVRAAKQVGKEKVEIDEVAFLAQGPSDAPPALPVAEKDLSIACREEGVAISPLIYGIAYNFQSEAKDQHQYTIGATARRWGGNPTSRYNWEHGAAWSTAHDWFYENVDYTGKGGAAYADFLKANHERGMHSALTVPILGWVAKDTTSYSFPVSVFGPQRAVDPYKPDAGNGVGPDGKDIRPGPPSRTSVPVSPEQIRKWVERIREADKAQGSRSVHMYILDNEPMLWNSTHRDVHPEPTTYDELLDKTLRFGAAVRAADPDGVIAGPALWGWPAYFFSAKDQAEGFWKKPDRLAHGDVPFLAWYLRELAAYHKKTGTRILDVVDVHFYPQAQGVGGKDGGTDAQAAALRIRSTRALWDPTYKDESWIKDTVMLIPRMKQIIAENYPGLGLAIGEYNFGAEDHPSGGIALAEALGRFAEGGVTAAFYWTYPPDRSPAYWAFRAYRNFDGKGGHFLERSIGAKAAEGASIFASRDKAGSHVVAIVLNPLSDKAIRPKVTLDGCTAREGSVAYVYSGGSGGFAQAPLPGVGATIRMDTLSPYSIAVLDLRMEVTP